MGRFGGHCIRFKPLFAQQDSPVHSFPSEHFRTSAADVSPAMHIHGWHASPLHEHRFVGQCDSVVNAAHDTAQTLAHDANPENGTFKKAAASAHIETS